MGLPARQRRVLDRIESALRGSDPRLAALYAVFGRLTRDEEMPRIEQLRHRVVLLTVRLRGRLTYFLGRIFGRLIPRQPAVLFFPLALAVVAVTLVVAAQSGGANRCSQTQLAAGSAHQASSRLCKSPNPYGTMYMGR